MLSPAPPSFVIILNVILISLIFLIILCSNLIFYSTISAFFSALFQHWKKQRLLCQKPKGTQCLWALSWLGLCKLLLPSLLGKAYPPATPPSNFSPFPRPFHPDQQFYPKWIPFLPRNPQNLPTPARSQSFLQSSGHHTMMGTRHLRQEGHQQPTCFCSSCIQHTHMCFCG